MIQKRMDQVNLIKTGNGLKDAVLILGSLTARGNKIPRPVFNHLWAAIKEIHDTRDALFAKSLEWHREDSSFVSIAHHVFFCPTTRVDLSGGIHFNISAQGSWPLKDGIE
jgi:hypothetical protein